MAPTLKANGQAGEGHQANGNAGLAAASDRMRLKAADSFLDWTRKWLEDHQTTSPDGVPEAVLLSRIASSCSSMNSPVASTENQDGNIADDSSRDQASDLAASPDAATSSNASNKAEDSMDTEEKSEDGNKDDNGPSDMAVDDAFAETVKEKRRGQPPRTRSTQSTARDPAFPRNDDAPRIQKSSGGIYSLVGIANGLANALGTCNSLGKEDSPLTVAQVASECLELVQGESSRNRSFFRSVVCPEEIKGNEEAKRKNEELFNTIIEVILKQIGKSAKWAVEARSDFEYLWNACCEKEAFCRKDSASVIKECAWKLSCVSSLHQRYSAVQEESKSKMTASSSETATRRKRLLTNAACIGLLLSLSSESPGSKNAESEMEIDGKTPNENGSKKREMSTRDGTETSTAPEDNGSIKYSDSKTSPRASPVIIQATDGPASKRRRLAIEDEAIAALSMMVTSGSRGSSPNTSKASHSSDDEESADVVEAILKIAKEMQEQVFVSGVKISRHELEDEIIGMSKLRDAQSCTLADTPRESKEEPPKSQSRLGSMLSTDLELSMFTDVEKIDEMLRVATKKLVDKINVIIMEREGAAPTTKRWIDVVKFVPFVADNRLLSARPGILSRLCMTVPQYASKDRENVAYVITYRGKSESTQGSPSVVTITSEPNEVADLVSYDPKVTDGIDLNEWTACIMSLSKMRPNTRLLLYLDASDDELSALNRRRRQRGKPAIGTGGWRDVMYPVLHRAVDRMNEAEGGNSQFADAGSSSITISLEDGEIIFDEDEPGSSKELSPDRKVWKSVFSLFYHALETILYHETARLKSASHPGLIQCSSFHKALLACCYVSVVKAVGSSGTELLGGKFQPYTLKTILQLLECSPYAYLKVSETFIRSLTDSSNVGGTLRKPPISDIPGFLEEHLRHCEVQVMDSILWAFDSNIGMDGGSVMDTVGDLRKTSMGAHNDFYWPPEILMPSLPQELEDDPESKYSWAASNKDRLAFNKPEYHYTTYLLRKVLKVSFFRISALCNALDIPPEYPVASQVWVAFRYLLRHQIELLYNRHLDQLILCTLYGVCKIMKLVPDVTFAKSIEVYTKVRGREVGERKCQRIVRHIWLQPNQGNKKNEFGNIIHLYNQVYVPTMKNHLLQSKSLKKATTELQSCASKGSTRRIYSADDATQMADRVVNSVNGSWPEPTLIPVVEGNVKVNLRLRAKCQQPNLHLRNGKPNGRPVKTPGEAVTPKTRNFYKFGGASVKNLELANKVIRASDMAKPFSGFGETNNKFQTLVPRAIRANVTVQK